MRVKHKYIVQASIIFFFVCALLFFLVTTFIPKQVPYPERQQPVIEHLQNNKPTLLKQYTIHDEKPDYTGIQYRPRQFRQDVELASQITVTNAGEYRNWDALIMPITTKNATQNIPDWLILELNRPAILAVVWFGDEQIPAWLSGWQRASAVSINGIQYTTYKKVSKNTNINLGNGGSYFVLFAESNGNASVEPKFPQNLAIPVPNQKCPDWVHDEYKARAPDGKLYPTWHPQIDPVYWCYFNHEHGSDPSLFAKNYRIPFGYAGNAMGMHEAHPGYKVYVWDDNYGYLWLALQHQGTATNQAACGRYHELDITAKDKQTNIIVSEQYFVGDYGLSRSLATPDALKPSKCPDQGKIEPGNIGVRFLPVKDHGALMEEPWTINSKDVLGFNFASFTVNTYDPMRMCQDITCDHIVYTGASGTNHALMYVKGFGPKAGGNTSGIYYTDPMGMKLETKSQLDSVRQYINPGISISSNIPFTSTKEASCRDIDGSGGIFHCGMGLTSESTMRENSIKIPN